MKEPPLTPVIASDWVRIVATPERHLNDFCLFLDRRGRWHAIGIAGTGTWESEQSLFHFVGDDLLKPFEPRPDILTAPPPDNAAPQKHAPFVVVVGRRYHLFYRRPPGAILRLETDDPDRWPDDGDVVFAENDARDVCIVRIHDAWHMYYCEYDVFDGVGRSAIFLRRSDDLVRWGEAEVVHVDTGQPCRHSYLESPFVIQRPEGFYLFIRHRLFDARRTTVVLHSKTADRFPSGDGAWFAELHDVHAPELLALGPRWYIARVSGPAHSGPGAPAKGGWIDVALLDFV